jgi:hypothetical protein
VRGCNQHNSSGEEGREEEKISVQSNGKRRLAKHNAAACNIDRLATQPAAPQLEYRWGAYI